MGILALIFIHNATLNFSIFGFVLALFLGIFLFWRAGRHELVESQTLLDVVVVFLGGVLLFGRLFDFAVRFDFYHWSFKKLIFFNVFPGFDIHGAFIGGLFFVWFYLSRKREKFWFVFDLAASAVAFGAFLYLLFKLLESLSLKRVTSLEYLYYVIGYFVIFWSLKKFELRKKHEGFFASVLLVSTFLLNMLINLIFQKRISHNILIYHLAFSFILVSVTTINWYILSKRKIQKDIKSAFGSSFLTILKVKRVITNVREADSTAKAIVLSPLYLVKWGYFLVKYLVREFVSSIFDLAHSFGLLK